MVRTDWEQFYMTIIREYSYTVLDAVSGLWIRICILKKKNLLRIRPENQDS